VTANADLAEQLRRRADEAMARRRVYLTAATALASTTTLAAARRVLADPELRIPAAVKAGALQLLDGTESPETGGRHRADSSPRQEGP
jgi:hypothetical protein